MPGLEGAVAQPRVYGLRDSAMEFNQDGVPLDDRNTGNIQARPPGLDTIQEYRVETNGSSAKLDRPANAIMITRSGTNEFHGAAFETGRNSGFGVARQRQDTFSTAAAPGAQRIRRFRRRAGDICPRCTTARTAHSSSALGKNCGSGRLPAPGRRSGPRRCGKAISAACRTATAARSRSTIPGRSAPAPLTTKTPYVNNQLPIAKLSPLAKYVFGVVPLPTDLGVNPLVAQELLRPGAHQLGPADLTFRGDHRLSDKDQVFGRYSRGAWDQMNRRAFNTAGNPITSDNLWNRETYFERRTPRWCPGRTRSRRTFFMETVVTGSAINWLYSLNQPSAQQNISAQFGTPNPFNVNGAPYLLNVGYQGVQFHGIVPRSEYTQIISGEQNYTLVKGSHQIQFGGRFRQETLDTIPDRPDQSDLDFGSNATALYNPATGTAFGIAPQTGDNARQFLPGSRRQIRAAAAARQITT